MEVGVKSKQTYDRVREAMFSWGEDHNNKSFETKQYAAKGNNGLGQCIRSFAYDSQVTNVVQACKGPI